MNDDKAGGPAFPVESRWGMTLWDWYAGQALGGIPSDAANIRAMSDMAALVGEQTDSAIASIAAAAADAMIAERKKRGIV